MNSSMTALLVMGLTGLCCGASWAQSDRGIGIVPEEEVPLSVRQQAEIGRSAAERPDVQKLRQEAMSRAEKKRAAHGGRVLADRRTYISVERRKLLNHDPSAVASLVREIDRSAMKLPAMDIRYGRVSQYGEGESAELLVSLTQYINDMPVTSQNFRVSSDGMIEDLSFSFADPDQPSADPANWVSDARARAAAIDALRADDGVVRDYPPAAQATDKDLEISNRFYRIEGDDMTAVPYFHYELKNSGYAAEVNMLTGEASVYPLFREFSDTKIHVCDWSSPYKPDCSRVQP